MASEIAEHFRRLFAYDEWANRETLASLAASGDPPARALKLLAHILAAERLWLERLRQDEQSMAVWPELSLDECHAQVAELSRLWGEYLSDATAATLAQTVAYTNTKGEGWSNAVEDILMHVVMHSAYHRGQIASELRRAGYDAAYTDFIHCVRQQIIE